jgi:spermidine/putrescine transport system permease protein
MSWIDWYFIKGYAYFKSALKTKEVTIWKEIIIPYCMPGIMSGSIIVFMIALGSYLTPKLMGGKSSLWFTEQIYNQFILYFNWNQGSAFGFLLLLLPPESFGSP